MTFRIIRCLPVVLVLTACGEPGGGSAAAEVASRSLQPAEPALADVYNRSCRNCHTVAATGSPLTGDRPAWEPRLAKGMNTLVDNVVSGFGGMPPLGLCMDCDADQFEALIQFMAEAR
ncbi:cytochrome c5 family protein [Seongchinamella unica]|uniref:Cytochrome c5 family protein n=1 Tax=Seongchinamella unica TaxID=2547392 RepID=A0A4V2ZX84_9GAMM|nr:c-type cytochrome [Seongchinamella unica]TDG13634.1 cytochrome c5 family protein [Seongchinamella unica]